MSQNYNYLNKVYGKHTVALEFLADFGIDIVKNVTKSPELGKNLVGVGSNPNFLRLNAQYAQYGRYPKVLQNLG
jgi:hypothetical protein